MALPSSSATSAASTATTTASLDGRTDRLSFDESRGRAWEDLLHRFLSRGYSDRDISWIFTPNYSDRDSFWKEPQYYPDHDIRRGWGRRGYPQCQRVRKGDRRKRLGYTQTELAEVCDVGVMFVSQLEGGKPTAQLEKAIRVANRVGLDLEFRERG